MTEFVLLPFPFFLFIFLSFSSFSYLALFSTRKRRSRRQGETELQSGIGTDEMTRRKAEDEEEEEAFWGPERGRDGRGEGWTTIGRKNVSTSMLHLLVIHNTSGVSAHQKIPATLIITNQHSQYERDIYNNYHVRYTNVYVRIRSTKGGRGLIGTPRTSNEISGGWRGLLGGPLVGRERWPSPRVV